MKQVKWIQYLKESIFGIKSDKHEVSKDEVFSQKEKTLPSELTVTPVPPILLNDSKKTKQRDPYLIQIGFDFGTSYSKCICRDIYLDKAWVHVPEYLSKFEYPFLMSSTLVVENGRIKINRKSQEQYPSNGLYHLKMALVSVAKKDWNNQVLNPYKRVLNSTDQVKLKGFISNCAVFFLGSMLGEVKDNIKKRFPGTHENDYAAINLAIPVADAQEPQVNDIFKNVLFDAWKLSEQLNKIPEIDLKALTNNRLLKSESDDIKTEKQCFIYPEVSANVQGFVRSRVSSEGIYLFSDTGAGTVDQSVFIFHKTNGIEELTYLEAQVYPIGSSQIEIRASNGSGSIDMWRERKESNQDFQELVEARTSICNELIKGTEKTLSGAKKKLINKSQINSTKILFGGGGHCANPYEKGAKKPFSGNLFPGNGIRPDVIGPPVPNDLQLKDFERKWMKRLSVAYGLCFLKDDLVKFIYPNELDTPTSQQVWQPRRDETFYIGQEMC